MNRNTAMTTWRDVCGSDTVMAIGVATGQMLEEFARRIEAAEREACAALLDAEHEKRKYDNHAGYFARMIRESGNTKE